MSEGHQTGQDYSAIGATMTEEHGVKVAAHGSGNGSAKAELAGREARRSPPDDGDADGPSEAPAASDGSATAMSARTLSLGVYQGPLPPPGALAQYEAACPGAADRIIAMAERQAKHRQDAEMVYATAEVRLATRAQAIGGALLLLLLAGGFFVLYLGMPAIGVARCV